MLINENLILLDLNAETKQDAIEALASLGYRDGRIDSLETYVENVLQREQTYTTGVGNGVAIPHAKSNSVKEAMIVFGKPTKAIEWGSLDDKPVDMVFLLGVPEDGAENLHLKIISQLSRKLMSEEFICTIRNATCKSEVMKALGDI